MTKKPEQADWVEVLDFWFPERSRPDLDARTHQGYWMWRMRGGADGEIVSRFTELTERAQRGELDHWANDPFGRLALIIVLDQFPRSVWRNSPRAYSQDTKALSLTLEGFSNGHYRSLETPWYKTIYIIPLGHCEGPDHLDRLDRAVVLAKAILDDAPPHLRPGYEFAAEQPIEVKKVISAFGRHPHRNLVLGRVSTPQEEAYIAEGKFPHLRMPASS